MIKIKVKPTPTLWSSHSTSRYLPKKKENMYSHKDLYTNVHNNFIDKLVTETETGNNPNIYQQVSGWTNFSTQHNKKEWIIDTWNNTDESLKNYTE